MLSFIGRIETSKLKWDVPIDFLKLAINSTDPCFGWPPNRPRFRSSLYCTGPRSGGKVLTLSRLDSLIPAPRVGKTSGKNARDAAAAMA